jgi:hypothetical protein
MESVEMESVMQGLMTTRRKEKKKTTVRVGEIRMRPRTTKKHIMPWRHQFGRSTAGTVVSLPPLRQATTPSPGTQVPHRPVISPMAGALLLALRGGGLPVSVTVPKVYQSQ